MISLRETITAAVAASERRLLEEAERLGCSVDQVEARRRAEADKDRRAEALARSRVALPESDLRRIVHSDIERTEAVDIVDRWISATDLDRPILLLTGAIGVGKTMASGHAIAASGGGAYVHAAELRQRIHPTRADFEAGVVPLNLRSSLVVLDDLGTESEPQRSLWSESFALFVERRMSLGRTLVTSNLAKSAFAQRYEPRIVDRLNAHAYTFELTATASLRRKGAGL